MAVAAIAASPHATAIWLSPRTTSPAANIGPSIGKWLHAHVQGQPANAVSYY